jgi:hypothetical protein
MIHSFVGSGVFKVEEALIAASRVAGVNCTKFAACRRRALLVQSAPDFQSILHEILQGLTQAPNTVAIALKCYSYKGTRESKSLGLSEYWVYWLYWACTGLVRGCPCKGEVTYLVVNDEEYSCLATPFYGDLSES